MAGSMNRVTLIGNLGADPDIRNTHDGRPIANLSVATTESWKDKNTQERRDKTEWHRVVIFSEGLCRVAQQYLRKGSKIYIEGQLQTRKWTDASGIEKYTTEIVLQNFSGQLIMLDSQNNNSNNKGYSPQYSDTNDNSTYNKSSHLGSESAQIDDGERGKYDRELDDDIPF